MVWALTIGMCSGWLTMAIYYERLVIPQILERERHLRDCLIRDITHKGLSQGKNPWVE